MQLIRKLLTFTGITKHMCFSFLPKTINSSNRCNQDGDWHGNFVRARLDSGLTLQLVSLVQNRFKHMDYGSGSSKRRYHGVSR